MRDKNKQLRKITEEPKQSGRNTRMTTAFEISENQSKKKHYIAGACLIFVGIILFVLALLPNSGGAISEVLSNAFHICFGVCSYIFPFVFVVCGISCFIESKDFKDRRNLAIGLFLISISFITFISFFAPIKVLGNDQLNLLFSDINLRNYGGYVGNFIGWVCLTLFGKVISIIICIFIFVVGLIIAGFSFSKFKNRFLRPIFNFGVNKDDFSHDQNEYSNLGENVDVVLDKNGDISDQSFDRFGNNPTVVFKNGQDNLNVVSDKPNVLSQVEGVEENKDTLENPVSNVSEDGYLLPSFDLLAQAQTKEKSKTSSDVLEQTVSRLQEAMHEFGVDANVVDWVAGPTVTLFKVELPPGVRVNKIQNLGTDLALALATSSVRIFAPIPGTNYVGIEVPNTKRDVVVLSEVLKNAHGGPLEMAIGKDVEGNSIISDLSKMPHLLIGGTTGSGKSVCVNAMIMSILMRATPNDVKMILIDPKRVEFTPYNGIPHLYVPVVTEPKEAASALSWGVAEMERRLKIMSEAKARNIIEYNDKVKSGVLDNEDEDKGNASGAEEKRTHSCLPYIVIIIDELADLMMSVGKEVEMSIVRIAQLARAAGIHLIVATQRPSTNVVTGLIKSNITNRIAFNVASSIDSRVILDSTGAEDLIGLGDMLLSKPEFAKPVRIQGCFVSEEEISRVVSFVKEQGEPDYKEEILSTSTNVIGIGDTNVRVGGAGEDDDPYLWEAADLVVNSGIGSTSNIQRRLKVGYARAGRIMDQLEEKGIVGPANGSRPREVLVDALELESVKTFELND